MKIDFLERGSCDSSNPKVPEAAIDYVSSVTRIPRFHPLYLLVFEHLRADRTDDCQVNGSVT